VVANKTEDPQTTTGGVTKRHLEKFCAATRTIDPKLRSIPSITQGIEAETKNEVADKTTRIIKRGTKTDMMGLTIFRKINRIGAKAGVVIAEDTLLTA